MGARLFRQKIMLYTSDRNNTYATRPTCPTSPDLNCHGKPTSWVKVRDPRIGASGGAGCAEGRRAPTLVATRLSLSATGEPGVNRLDDYRSFSAGRGHPLPRA